MKASFWPWRNTQNPGARHDATVTADNGDGTVNLIAHDGHDTPHENVPVVAEGSDVGAGFLAVLAPPDPDAELAEDDAEDGEEIEGHA